MRFMIIVKASGESEAQPRLAPDAGMMAEMGVYHEALARAGVLLDYGGLKPSRAGWRIRYDEHGRHVVDGPFADDAGDLVAGYTLIQVRSREEALEWSRRYPNPVRDGAEAVIEVRELDDPHPEHRSPP